MLLTGSSSCLRAALLLLLRLLLLLPDCKLLLQLVDPNLILLAFCNKCCFAVSCLLLQLLLALL
jgi:hypothetical protein